MFEVKLPYVFVKCSAILELEQKWNKFQNTKNVVVCS